MQQPSACSIPLNDHGAAENAPVVTSRHQQLQTIADLLRLRTMISEWQLPCRWYDAVTLGDVEGRIACPSIESGEGAGVDVTLQFTLTISRLLKSVRCRKLLSAFSNDRGELIFEREFVLRRPAVETGS